MGFNSVKSFDDIIIVCMYVLKMARRLEEMICRCTISSTGSIACPMMSGSPHPMAPGTSCFRYLRICVLTGE